MIRHNSTVGVETLIPVLFKRRLHLNLILFMRNFLLFLELPTDYTNIPPLSRSGYAIDFVTRRGQSCIYQYSKAQIKDKGIERERESLFCHGVSLTISSIGPFITFLKILLIVAPKNQMHVYFIVAVTLRCSLYFYFHTPN